MMLDKGTFFSVLGVLRQPGPLPLNSHPREAASNIEMSPTHQPPNMAHILAVT